MIKRIKRALSRFIVRAVVENMRANGEIRLNVEALHRCLHRES